MFKSILRIVRKYHAWVGVLAAIFIIMLSITGVLLNHPDVFFSKFTPDSDPFTQNPHYVTSLKDTIYLATDSALYQSKSLNYHFEKIPFPYSPAYIISMITHDGMYVIGLKNGIVLKTKQEKWRWQRIQVPENIYEIYSIFEKDETLFMSSNAGLYFFNDDSWKLQLENRSPVSFKSMVMALHTGYMPFASLKMYNTIASICLVFLVISGLYLFFRLYLKRR